MGWLCQLSYSSYSLVGSPSFESNKVFTTALMRWWLSGLRSAYHQTATSLHHPLPSSHQIESLSGGFQSYDYILFYICFLFSFAIISERSSSSQGQEHVDQKFMNDRL